MEPTVVIPMFGNFWLQLNKRVFSFELLYILFLGAFFVCYGLFIFEVRALNDSN